MGKKNDLIRQALSVLGSAGGRASAKALTKKQRLERAKKAGRASAKARAARVKGGRYEKKRRGDGWIFVQKDSVNWGMGYYDDKGEQHRESTHVARLHPECQSREETERLYPGDKSLKQAYRRLAEKVDEVRAAKRGLHTFIGPKQRRIRVNDLLDALEANYRTRGIHNSKLVSNLKPLREWFGHYRAIDLTPKHVDDYINHALAHGRRQNHEVTYERGDKELRYCHKANDKGSKPATINRSTQLLGQAYKLARERGELTSAPKITRLSESDNVRSGFLSSLEFGTVVENLPEHLQDFSRFGYLVGWRKSEITSLGWEEVDGDTIHLRAEHSKNGSRRTVPLVGELAQVINRRRLGRVVRTNNEVRLASLVFHHNGEPIGDFRKSWTTACKLANVSGKLFHDLRRTAVRNMVRAGVPEKVAMEISGHRTRAIFDRYSICSEDQKREALERTQIYLNQEQQRAVSATRQ
jgi:integrase